jgi:hypothetical protein
MEPSHKHATHFDRCEMGVCRVRHMGFFRSCAMGSLEGGPPPLPDGVRVECRMGLQKMSNRKPERPSARRACRRNPVSTTHRFQSLITPVTMQAFTHLRRRISLACRIQEASAGLGEPILARRWQLLDLLSSEGPVRRCLVLAFHASRFL